MNRRQLLAMAGFGAAAGLIQPASAATAWPDPEWKTATPEAEGMTAAGLDALKAFMGERKTNAGLVIRNGRITGEWFWEGSTMETLFPVYSITKSFAATAVGFLEAEGKLKLDQPAADFIPEWKSDDRAKVLIKHLLSMTSGQSKDEKTMYASADKVGFALAQKLQSAPGTKWDYNNIGCAALSAVIAKAAGEEMSAYLKRKLYDRIGISHYTHEEPAGHTLPYSGLAITARDLARFGLFYGNNGRWKDRPLLPARFTTAATLTSQDLNKGYGYLFWVNTGGAWGDVPRDAYAARGAFGNELLIIPSKGLVVARMVGTKPDAGIDLNKMGALAVAACSG